MKNIIIENVYNTIVVHRLAINKCSLFAAPNFDSKITCYNNKLNSQQMSRTCVIKRVTKLYTVFKTYANCYFPLILFEIKLWLQNGLRQSIKAQIY